MADKAAGDGVGAALQGDGALIDALALIALQRGSELQEAVI